MSREGILNAVSAERDYQDSRWGDAFDDKNTANDWASYIIRYAAKAAEFELSQQDFQCAMVKVAALAVAAIEASDRNNGPAPRHYDPQPEAFDQASENLFAPEGLQFKQLPEIEGLRLCDISHEAYRTYDTFHGCEYKIPNPVGLYHRPGGTTHRVVDSDGRVHCVAYPNEGRTVLRWESKTTSPVAF